jgi:AcrR family transcriptional regulator
LQCAISCYLGSQLGVGRIGNKVSQAKQRQWTTAFSTEALCARILERHRDAVRVQKHHVAVANLVRIIEATLKLSNKQGFHATSLRHLAQASGLSMGGLYSYFDNKTTLLSMILGEVSTTVNEVLGSVPEQTSADPSRHLNWLIESHIRLTEAMQPWFAFAYMEAKAFPPAGRQMAIDSEAATEEIFSKVLQQGVASGVFVITDIELTASLIKPLLQDWYVKRSKYRRRGTTIDVYIEEVVRIVEAAVKRC